MAKKGKKKKKNEDGEEELKKTKKPSEKSIFKSRVKELEKELCSARQELEHSDSALEGVKRLLAEEKESFESCVRHLRRMLSRTTTDELVDSGELDELRTDEMKRNLARNQEVARSLFLQEKSQLEDQLSRLESKRLERNSQLSRLKQQEETLSEQASSERLRRRCAHSDCVSKLLQRRGSFLRLVDGLAYHSKAVFSLSLPVRARRQLEENVRLRSGCEETSGAVLVLQDRIRGLKRLQKAADVELETQKSTEVDVEANIRRRLEDLEKENSILLESVKGLEPENLRQELKTRLSEVAQVEDDLESVSAVREDQVRYQKRLEERIQESRDRNGVRMSGILKAGEIFKGRMREVRVNRPDVDLLKQIAMILDDDRGVSMET